MNTDFLKPLMESGVISESTRDAINEAWQNKLNEARTEIRAEIREEFAERYEHDKEKMIEALDKMTGESLSEEIAKLKAEQNEAVAYKVKIVSEMKATAKKFNRFLTAKLAEEISEFRKDRKQFKESSRKLEGFVMKSLAEEITEFAQDKQDLARTKVKLVSEASKKLGSLKANFIKRGAKAVQETVEKALKAELKQLHEDITEAQKNNFGRRIFEAFANEYMTTYLNENKEMRGIRQKMTNLQTQLAEAKTTLKQKNQILEAKNQEIKRIAKRQERDQILKELMSPLVKDKQAVMGQLLESVQTNKLRAAYDKYLPSVLNNSAKKKILSESHIGVTGDKKSVKTQDEDAENIIDIKRLAGLN